MQTITLPDQTYSKLIDTEVGVLKLLPEEEITPKILDKFQKALDAKPHELVSL